MVVVIHSINPSEMFLSRSCWFVLSSFAIAHRGSLFRQSSDLKKVLFRVLFDAFPTP